MMSSFSCPHCKASLIDTPIGYITECEHYPLDKGGRAKAIGYLTHMIKTHQEMLEDLRNNGTR